jgi:hypothetical protein
MDVSKYILVSRYIYVETGISGRREYYEGHCTAKDGDVACT